MTTPDRPMTRTATAVALLAWQGDVADALPLATNAELVPCFLAADLFFGSPDPGADLAAVLRAAGDALIAITRGRTEAPREPSTLDLLRRSRTGLPRGREQFPFPGFHGDYSDPRNVEIIARALKIATPESRSSYLSALTAWCSDPMSREDITLHWLAAKVLVASAIEGNEAPK